MLILDKFFLKYEEGVKLTPPEKTTLKKPSLIRVKEWNKAFTVKFAVDMLVFHDYKLL